ncbi:MAG: hypothetical protein Q9157_002943 [Trypethelium eluteriae]
MVAVRIDPYLTGPDHVVLSNLFHDVQKPLSHHSSTSTDKDAIAQLQALNDEKNPGFQPTVFTTWDEKDLPPWINDYLVKPYTTWAKSVVRHPTDVVFLTHIITYFLVSVPSAILLFYHFTWVHGVLHAIWSLWCAGSFTLMMHNHIHNNGVLSKSWAWLDYTFPYILEPLMGHTWDSYYYHHVKHHHVESNGPDDLSSTVRYQRDDLLNFLCYVGRFLFLIWLELPLYFVRKGKLVLACKAGTTELVNYLLIYLVTTRANLRASTFVFLIPFVQLRLGLMIGNWGQHALVDEREPDSDFRSSITLMDVPSNRFCFNDGYHTAHHLNPRRHWRDQPIHFLQQKEAYRNGRALVFHNIDYLMMTVKLLQKDYEYLAKCLVPIGEQTRMSQLEIVAMLRTKTKRFTEEDIARKFKPSTTAPSARKRSGKKKGVEDAFEVSQVRLLTKVQ